MWLRRALFGWLIPSAFVLPLWLLVGWGVFNAGGWAFLWVIFLAIPGVFLWQLLLTLLVRARGTVRAHRAVSWPDAGGFVLWHAMVISLGFFVQSWWAPMLALTILVGIGVFWLALWQLWREARPSGLVMRTTEGVAYIPASAEGRESAAGSAGAPEVIVLSEKRAPTD
ncbi:hypothetical protein JOD63_001123 [Microbacterium terrae]|uniref:MFS transporter permease n=1 Tax=Microbacterium terrae TaxID=69369 RepID=A0A0M2H3H6_9MICO|nr:MFS transporter permease [Microbacterium terrae]KJL38905.1 hypothetical protein RS81_02314 [Microbacterium terrae]MBP1077155.1 hypothetical protein [Microbacterium terrae]GLJ99748.1 hypothetical protein GCM10017594_29460 [Microbacterium terrae]